MNNRISIGESCYLNNCTFWIDGNDNEINIGRLTSFNAGCNLTCMDGHKLLIGENCLFSTEINFQVGDGHRIYDNAGFRTNETRNIIIGRHVWIGKRATLLKGAEVADGSVVAAGAHVTKAFQEPNVIIAGLPAKIIRRNVKWEK